MTVLIGLPFGSATDDERHRSPLSTRVKVDKRHVSCLLTCLASMSWSRSTTSKDVSSPSARSSMLQGGGPSIRHETNGDVRKVHHTACCCYTFCSFSLSETLTVTAAPLAMDVDDVSTNSASSSRRTGIIRISDTPIPTSPQPTFDYHSLDGTEQAICIDNGKWSLLRMVTSLIRQDLTRGEPGFPR